jgi:hypothetical protein
VPTLVLAGLLAAGLVGLLLVVIVTTVNARAVEAWMAAGRPAVATVADRPDEVYRLAVDVRPSDTPSARLQMFANADFPEDYLTGDKYPAVLSEDSTRVRLLIERYDRTEPRLWVLLPTALIGWLLIRRLAGM